MEAILRFQGSGSGLAAPALDIPHYVSLRAALDIVNKTRLLTT